jgi:zinc transport system permease protein
MLEFLQYDFIIRALLAGSILGLALPILGLFLVVKRYSNLADTLSHVSLVAVLASLITGLAALPVTILTTVSVSLGIEKFRQSQKIYGETALAIVLSGSLGLTAILISATKQGNTQLFNFLFGGLNFVNQTDLIQLYIVVPIVLFTLLFIRKQLLIISLDEELATAEGLPVKLINNLFIALCAIVISLGITAVGVLLLSTLMVIPVVSAQLFKQGLAATVLISTTLSLLSIWSGIIFSFYFNIATGGLIVMINLLFFTIGIVWQNFHK